MTPSPSESAAGEVSPRLAQLAGGVLLVLACACVVVALLVLRSFRAALPDPLALTLVGVPLLAAASLAMAARARPGRRVLLSTTAIGVVVALYVMDVVVALTPSLARPTENAARQAAAARGGAFDERSYSEIVDSVAAVRGEAFPAGAMALLQRHTRATAPPILPFGGVANAAHVLCRESGTQPVYDSDEHGFNNPRGLWALDSLQVAALGDSFTHGLCVPAESGYVALIRQRYPATLNLGIVGEGPLYELATLREYLPRYRPRAVLWFFYEGNDLSDFEVEKVDPVLPRYREEGFRQGLLERQPLIDSLVRAAYRERRAPPPRPAQPVARPSAMRRRARALYVTLRQTVALGHLTDMYSSTLREAVGLRARADAAGAAGLAGRCCDLAGFEDVLRRAKATTESWGGTLYFVYMPGYDFYSPPHIRQKETRQRDRVLAAARHAGLPVIDLDEAYRAHGDPHSLFYHPNSHLNPEGQRVVANAILARLAK